MRIYYGMLCGQGPSDSLGCFSSTRYLEPTSPEMDPREARLKFARVVPGPFLWPEALISANPSRPVCYMRYTNYTELDSRMPVTSP